MENRYNTKTNGASEREATAHDIEGMQNHSNKAEDQKETKGSKSLLM